MGECYFWYQPTRVVPDKRPLNDCVCIIIIIVIIITNVSVCLYSKYYEKTALLADPVDGMILASLLGQYISRELPAPV